MSNILYNNSITKNSFLGQAPKLTKLEQDLILAEIFEQLLLFDKIVISTDKDNYALAFLIHRLGLDTVERLVKSNYINFSVKAAVIFSGTGRQLDDGTIDESVIYTQPPIVGGSLGKKEIDPENNIISALRHFSIDTKRRNSLLKTIVPKYIVTEDLNTADNVAKLVTDAYVKNNLENLGLPFTKDLYDLNLEERKKLFSLGHSVLETAMLAENGFKSYNKYNELEIAKQNYENIGKAYNISSNTSQIFRIENTPDLKEIYLQNNFDIADIFKLRHLSSAKHFRKWINEIGENQNANEVTESYLAEIKGKNKFFNTNKGKLIKNTFMFGATTGLGLLVNGPVGGVVGVALKPAADLAVDYSLGILEEFFLDGIINGRNPQIFIDKFKEELGKKNKKVQP